MQRELVSDGIPLCWLTDVPVWNRDFAAVQRLVMAGGYGGNEKVLDFRPEAPIGAEERALWIGQVTADGAADPCGSGPVSRATFAAAMTEAGLT